MRFVLLISVLAATLRADPVNVVETRTAFGGTNLSYFYDVPVLPGPLRAKIHGNATCYILGSCNQRPNSSASVSIYLALDLYSAGPIRDGIAHMALGIEEDVGTVSGAIGPYSLGGCPSEIGCYNNGYFPFELGVPFTIRLSGTANAYPPQGDYFSYSADFSAYASLQLYELPTQAGDSVGAPVQIYLVPEPGSARLAFTGLSAFALFAVKQRRIDVT